MVINGQTMKCIYVAGHNGLVGQALVRKLSARPDIKLLVAERSELDLLDQQAVYHFFKQHKIDEVYLAAAKVGGILANRDLPADFIYQNLQIACNVIHAAYQSDVTKLLNLGSSCIYPRLAIQPMSEESLLAGHLEPTNEPYAIAKIAAIKLCESYYRQHGCDFRSVMPTNLYGPFDNFHPIHSHVIPALMQRFHLAKRNNEPQLSVWGTGKVRREFLYVDDLAQACMHLMDMDTARFWALVSPMQSHINIGCGSDISIAELARTMADITGYSGTIHFDTSKPDGTPRKWLDSSLLFSTGWRPQTDLLTGLDKTYQWYLSAQN